MNITRRSFTFDVSYADDVTIQSKFEAGIELT